MALGILGVGAFPEGVLFIGQVEENFPVYAAKVTEPYADALAGNLLLAVVRRNDEVSRHHHIGPVHHDVVNGAVQFLRGGLNLILERLGIDVGALFPHDGFSGGILRRL